MSWSSGQNIENSRASQRVKHIALYEASSFVYQRLDRSTSRTCYGTMRTRQGAQPAYGINVINLTTSNMRLPRRIVVPSLENSYVRVNWLNDSLINELLVLRKLFLAWHVTCSNVENHCSSLTSEKRRALLLDSFEVSSTKEDNFDNVYDDYRPCRGLSFTAPVQWRGSWISARFTGRQIRQPDTDVLVRFRYGTGTSFYLLVQYSRLYYSFMYRLSQLFQRRRSFRLEFIFYLYFHLRIFSADFCINIFTWLSSIDLLCRLEMLMLFVMLFIKW